MPGLLRPRQRIRHAAVLGVDQADQPRLVHQRETQPRAHASGIAFRSADYWDLDAAFPDRPVWIERIDGHAYWGNSAALKTSGASSRRRSAGSRPSYIASMTCSGFRFPK